jgi:AraC-like DNA-binding protein
LNVVEVSALARGWAPNRWSTEDVGFDERRSAWGHVLAASYGRFDLARQSGRAFRADLASRTIAGMSLVSCTTNACRGERSRRIVGLDAERRFGIQVLLKGEERMTCGESSVRLAAGSVVLWDSAMPSTFEVRDEISKATIVFPEPLLRERLPRDVSLAGTLIDAVDGLGAVLRTHVTTLVEQRDSFDRGDAGLRNMTLDLLAAALQRQASPREFDEARDTGRRLERIQGFMLANLSDCELMPAAIACANGISLRYLHLLFHASGTTAAAWLKEQRLLRCRDEMLSAAGGVEPLTHLACRFGFRDAANFSRDFKLRFGRSPSTFRANRP